jgi:uncharacterized FlaG/YvyC family protein
LVGGNIVKYICCRTTLQDTAKEFEKQIKKINNNIEFDINTEKELFYLGRNMLRKKI